MLLRTILEIHKLLLDHLITHCITCQTSSKNRFHTRDGVRVNIFGRLSALVVFTPETNNNPVMNERGDIVCTKHDNIKITFTIYLKQNAR